MRGREKLLAMHAGVTSAIKLNETADGPSFYCGKNHQMAGAVCYFLRQRKANLVWNLVPLHKGLIKTSFV